MRIIFSFIFTVTLLFNTAFAVSLPNPDNFINAGLSNKYEDIRTGNLLDIMDGSLSLGLSSVLKLLYAVGLIVAVSIFAFVGIQVVIASPQQKAQLKASLVPYFVGLLLFVAGVPIAIFIINAIIGFFK